MIIFNTDDCIKCEACEGICPSNAIKVQPNNIIHCDTCGDSPKCAEICPNDALKVDFLTLEESGAQQARLIFNGLKCDQCGKCVETCPQNTITLTNNPKIPLEGFCVMCQQCVEICPLDYVGIEGIKDPNHRELNIEGPIYIENCVGCGTCIEECPVQAISLNELGEPIEINSEICIKCGVCSQTCPWNAVFISEKIPTKRTKEITEFKLNESSCIGCKTCVEICPGDFIKFNDNNLTITLPKMCAACGLCEKMCSVNAISLNVKLHDATPCTEEGVVCDAEKCDHIGACAMKCPTQAIHVVTKTGMSVPEQIKSDEDPSFKSCIRCGACASSCPNNALTLDTEFEINKNGTLIKRPRIQYNPSKCDQCGDCVNSCPYNMLKTTDNPKLPIAGFCTLCGQCIETCPEKALSYK
ncbi:4Fe-4S binding protein [Methanobrevibacter smithii]|uniref:4Fe-4S binding protein n=1 Tax=Methanobrevibacter smithii TaxID=2173 RepID=UPI001C02A30C|nr:4Fe-4S binding protein [Methanobrevibacter smithii]MBT9658815.1 4Fe-4S dicluster domain-containing protein [Methanobrevibacter smithii]